MRCKNCGQIIESWQKECPYCYATNDQYQEKVVEEANKDKNLVSNQTYVRYGNNQTQNDDVDGIRTADGFVNLHTKWWHHLLIAIGCYLGMQILATIILRVHITASAESYKCLATNAMCTIEDKNAAALALENASSVVQVVCELIFILTVMLIFSKHLKTFFSEAKEGKTWIGFGIGLGIMYGTSIVYNNILNLLKLQSTSSNQDAVDSFISSNLLFGFIFVVIAAPIFEEIVFRFGVFRAFQGSKKRQIIGFIVTVILFAGIHMVATFTNVFADVNNPNWELFKSDMLTFPVYIIGAVGLTFAYYKSKNLLSSILAHMTYNFLSFLAIIAYKFRDQIEEVIKLIFRI